MFWTNGPEKNYTSRAIIRVSGVYQTSADQSHNQKWINVTLENKGDCLPKLTEVVLWFTCLSTPPLPVVVVSQRKSDVELHRSKLVKLRKNWTNSHTLTPTYRYNFDLSSSQFVERLGNDWPISNGHFSLAQSSRPKVRFYDRLQKILPFGEMSPKS